MKNSKALPSVLIIIAIIFSFTLAGLAAGTVVPGHAKKCDQDGNGFCDDGVMVNGHYTALYAFDANGDWFLDYGDDRPGSPAGTVSSVDKLEDSTLTVCDYVINYRGDFGNDPFMDSGWVQNHIKCSGYSVKNGDIPRSTNFTIDYPGGQYRVYTVSKEGNILVVPEKHNN